MTTVHPSLPNSRQSYIYIYLCVWSTRTVLVHSSEFGERTNRCWLGKSVHANQGRTGKTGSSICPARSHTLPRSALASNRSEMILSWLPLEVEGLQFWCSSRNIKSCKRTYWSPGCCAILVQRRSANRTTAEWQIIFGSLRSTSHSRALLKLSSATSCTCLGMLDIDLNGVL